MSQWQKLCRIAPTLGKLSAILSTLLWMSPSTWLSTLDREGDHSSFVGLPWIETFCMRSDPALLSLVSDQILTLQFISNSSSQNAWPNMARQAPLWTFGWHVLNMFSHENSPYFSSIGPWVPPSAKSRSSPKSTVELRDYWCKGGQTVVEDKRAALVILKTFFTRSRPKRHLPALKALATRHPRFARTKEILLWKSL